MNFRRYYIPGAAVFITQVVKDRHPIFRDADLIVQLRLILHSVQRIHPFVMLGYVFLPDHFHMIIQPGIDTNFSQIMQSLKSNFTKCYKTLEGITAPTTLWQKRFWDHVIRDDRDMENHLHYIHFNPVKHGFVTEPGNWQDSSYTEWERRGLYPKQFIWYDPKNMQWGE